jgi:hypothetical protein
MLITASISFSSYFFLVLILLTFLTGVYSLILYRNTQHGNIINFINITQLTCSAQNLILLTHLLPAVLIIINPEIISLWS